MEIAAKKLPYLTQVAEVADEQRVYVTKVTGYADNLAELWREASQEERNAWVERMKEKEQEYGVVE